ncbi:ABC transporter substrate-binding protein [Pontiellaceae bacterium B12227]|nr:ABC transporter substrate-binding protein [Pontiellaceae bacterium B12227]
MKSTRQGFIQGSIACAGLSASLGAKAESKTKLPITIAGYDVDKVRALAAGKVQVEGCNTTFVKDAIGDMNTAIFSGQGTREVSEVGLHPFMLAYANEGFRDYSLIPVFPIRTFRHKSIFIRAGSGIEKPEDLKGREIATAGYSSTSLTWIRGMLEHEYGVRPKDIHWVLSQKDSGADTAGTISKQEQVVPDGIKASFGTPGLDESELLVNGEVDAIFHAAEPRHYVQGDPRVQRLFPDFRSTEQAYYKKTGIFPIMHAVAMRKTSIKKYPWLPKAVFNAYAESKKIQFNYMQKLGWAYESLPWFPQEFEETKKVMGNNYWPYGIEPNRKALEALFQYSYEQGLASKQLSIEELFEPSTLKLTD